ncbi:hypothetical protein C5167_025193 [Papaver somniferum]|uniref:CRM domain-containing protein n=1 Tax=Papaver somniferum TaxID=3469 RepID=A0A4Y7JTS4_PAPSO|nr:hypothetical protein C5167_025193 [Papaver somniferum]
MIYCILCNFAVCFCHCLLFHCCVGRDCFTHNILNDIHNNWKTCEAVRIRCLGVPTVNMKNVCNQLEGADLLCKSNKLYYNIDAKHQTMAKYSCNHTVLNDIHNNWKTCEAVRIWCLGVPTVDTKNVCNQLDVFCLDAGSTKDGSYATLLVRSPISVAAAVTYMITQLSDEKKLLRGLRSSKHSIYPWLLELLREPLGTHTKINTYLVRKRGGAEELMQPLKFIL